MAHFIVTPFGSAGDVHPLVAIALALQQRGHRVTFIVNGYFERLVRRVGLEYRELGTREEFLELAVCPDLWHPLKAFPYIFRRAIEPLMREHFRVLADYAGQEDVVVISGVLGIGAVVAHEKLGVPLITAHLQPSALCSDIEPPEFPGSFGPKWLRRCQYRLGKYLVINRVVRPSLNAWREELGLAPVRDVTKWWHSPWYVVCLFPEWFAAPLPDWPPTLVQTGFPLWDERTEGELAPELASFLEAGTPPLVFTPGSANLFGRTFFEAAVGACRLLGRRGILLTQFPEQVPAHLPNGLVHFAYVPFSQLLPRCAALVHHGGIGTLAQAFAAGVPQIVVALAHDQFDNAERVRQLGVGDALPFHRLSAKRLAERLRPWLDIDERRDGCRAMARRMAHQDIPAQTAISIEHFLESSSLRCLNHCN